MSNLSGGKVECSEPVVAPPASGRGNPIALANKGHSFTFDAKLLATITVEAADEAAARIAIDDALADSESANLGCWPNGEPIVASFSADGEHDLIEIDGEEV